MEPEDRFYFIYQNHFGLGIRWEHTRSFPLSISIAIPFVAFVFGVGKRR